MTLAALFSVVACTSYCLSYGPGVQIDIREYVVHQLQRYDETVTKEDLEFLAQDPVWSPIVLSCFIEGSRLAGLPIQSIIFSPGENENPLIELTVGNEQALEVKRIMDTYAGLTKDDIEKLSDVQKAALSQVRAQAEFLMIVEDRVKGALSEFSMIYLPQRATVKMKGVFEHPVSLFYGSKQYIERGQVAQQFITQGSYDYEKLLSVLISTVRNAGGISISDYSVFSNGINVKTSMKIDVDKRARLVSRLGIEAALRSGDNALPGIDLDVDVIYEVRKLRSTVWTSVPLSTSLKLLEQNTLESSLWSIMRKNT